MAKCGAFQSGGLFEFGGSEIELGTESNESCVESKLAVSTRQLYPKINNNDNTYGLPTSISLNLRYDPRVFIVLLS